MLIKKQLVKNRTATFPGTNRRTYITIHETGNTKKGAGAQAHAHLQAKGFSASWHWQVDDQMAIQSYPHTVQCWHAGDGRGKGNLQSIAIEICVNEDSHLKTAVDNAVTLTKMIMKEEGIAATNVVQHHHWNGKNCPEKLRVGKSGVSWQVFQAQLKRTSPIIESDLRFGSTGGAVKALQRTLNQLDYRLVVDGSFGRATEKAVRFCQSMYGMQVDGVVRNETQKLFKRLLDKRINEKVHVLKYGSNGPAVEQLQKCLQELGYPLTIDGSFGPATRRAVLQFQKNHQLDIDSFVGIRTWSTLKKMLFK